MREELITARMARPDDAQAITSLWRRFMTEEHEAVPASDPEQAVSRWSERLHSQIEKGEVFLVALGQDTVGFVGFIDSREGDWLPEKVAYLVDIYVVPEARKRGAAKALFEAVMTEASRRYEQVWTNTHKGNRRVQVLLRRAGFEEFSGFEIQGLSDQMYFRRRAKDA